MKIDTEIRLEEAATYYGILPFFRNNIKGFSVEEMTTPELLFGGNEYEGCWEWKGPVIRNRTTAYGKFFRKKAGFVSLELLPYFLKMRRSEVAIPPGSVDEMIYDIISVNDRMTSTDLRETMLGKPRRRTACDLPDITSPMSGIGPGFPADGAAEGKRPSRHTLEAPLQRLQMGGYLCISDFRYKQTKRGERYGWGVAEYSTPEMLFDSERLTVDLSPEECREYIVDYVMERFPGATKQKLYKLFAYLKKNI